MHCADFRPVLELAAVEAFGGLAAAGFAVAGRELPDLELSCHCFECLQLEYIEPEDVAGFGWLRDEKPGLPPLYRRHFRFFAGRRLLLAGSAGIARSCRSNSDKHCVGYPMYSKTRCHSQQTSNCPNEQVLEIGIDSGPGKCWYIRHMESLVPAVPADQMVHMLSALELTPPAGLSEDIDGMGCKSNFAVIVVADLDRFQEAGLAAA